MMSKWIVWCVVPARQHSTRAAGPLTSRILGHDTEQSGHEKVHVYSARARNLVG
jgi:hypothetical protein